MEQIKINQTDSLTMNVFQNKENFLAIRLHGFIEVNNCFEFQRKMNLLLKNKKQIVLLDFENLNHISSVGIASIMSIYKQIILNEGDLVIYPKKPHIFKIFEAINLTKFLKFTNSYESAKKLMSLDE